MKKKTLFIGIDIGCDNFVATILNNKITHTSEFTNYLDGFESFNFWLEENKVTTTESIIVMESTGVYCEQLCHFLYSKKYELCVENALKVKRAFDLSPRKNDIVDSRRIAEYAMRFTDQLILWQPPEQILEKVKILLSLREQFVNQNTANKNILKALNKKVIQSDFAVDTLELTISDLKEKIESIEKEIKNLLLINKEIASKYLSITSIKGVSLLLSSELLVLTDGFRKTNNPREIASYIGICPHEYSSGKSVYKKAKSSGYGHARIRKLIYLASCCAREYNDEFKIYFERKVNEGKSKRVLINNISNKLIKLICGVIKSGKNFIPNFKSLPPILLK